MRAIAFIALVAGSAFAQDMPSFESVRAAARGSEAYLLARDGSVLQQKRIDYRVRRLPWVALGEVSSRLAQAIVLAEDRRFYEHHGVDWRALADATRRALSGASRRGASTISMQVATLLREPRRRSGARSWQEKLAQIRAAHALERQWSKTQILEAYLNTVHFRGELQGIAAAAWALFNKAPSGLTEAEALLLAALLPAPNAQPAQVAARACRLAARSAAAVTCARLHALSAAQLDTPVLAAPGLAPHLGARLLRASGESVRSTINAELQRYVIGALHDQLRDLGAQRTRDGAVIVVENASGEVLAYVGGGWQASAAHVDGASALRQAGSTLKPFLYAAALERGYLTAASIIDDSPVSLGTPTGSYLPQNYDREFKGRVSLRSALAGSLNIPAIRTLALVGTEAFVTQLRALGYHSLTQSGEYYGYALALGSPEVSLLAQVNAYRTLANGGWSTPLRFRFDSPRGAARQVISKEAAFLVSDILADRAARGITFGLDSVLATPYWSAVKTGTSKDMRDNWCIGYSARYTVGVWVGNFSGEPMLNVSGVSGAAPLWRAIMDRLQRDGHERASAPPPAVVGLPVRFSGVEEAARSEWFIRGTELERIKLADGRYDAPRIAYPAEGMVFAIDPDIPSAQQAIFLRAENYRSPFKWLLDGAVLQARGATVKWRPLPGPHQVQLVDAQGNVTSSARFSVRGARARTGGEPDQISENDK